MEVIIQVALQKKQSFANVSLKEDKGTAILRTVVVRLDRSSRGKAANIFPPIFLVVHIEFHNQIALAVTRWIRQRISCISPLVKTVNRARCVGLC